MPTGLNLPPDQVRRRKKREDMKFTFSDPVLPKAGTVVLPVLIDRTLSASGTELDAKTDGLLTRAMTTGKFTGKAEETLAVVAPAGIGPDHILLVGLGKPDQVT